MSGDCAVDSGQGHDRSSCGRRPVIVISAAKLINMGGAAILQDCLSYCSRELADAYEIIAVVHDQGRGCYPRIRYVELPQVARSYFRQLYWQYHGLSQLSRKWRPKLWLSLENLTPTVTAERRAVYCQNAALFYRPSFAESVLDPKYVAFYLALRYFYGVNIKKNTYVVVQQDWMRKEFQRRYDLHNVVVARPTVDSLSLFPLPPRSDGVFRFFYPSYPRVFKNFELVGDAARRLHQSGVRNFEVYVTFDGSENAYSRLLRYRFASVPEMRFTGLLTREAVFAIYQTADCLIFPSKNESWGLPLTEFQVFNKPILAADLPYSRETMATYGKAAYFHVADAGALSTLMCEAVEGRLQFAAPACPEPPPPACRNWAELFELLLADRVPQARCAPELSECTAQLPR